MEESSKIQMLDNLQYFISELLQVARTTDVWSADTLKDARQWANFCNKFSLKMKEVGQFDTCVQVLAQRMPGIDTENILSILQDPITALNRAYLMNPSLDKALLAMLLDMNLVNESSDAFFDEFSRVVLNNNVVHKLMTTPTEMTSELKEFHANLQRQLTLAQFTELAFCNNERSIDDYLTASFHSTDEHMVQLVENLILLATSLNSKSGQSFDRVIAKLVDKCVSDSKARYFILKQENLNLAQLAFHSEFFYDFYTNALREDCESLFRLEENSIDDTWENSVGHLSFGQLARQWTALMKGKQPMAGRTADFVKECIINSKNLVWLEILRIGSN